jgi:hypothetical protein
MIRLVLAAAVLTSAAAHAEERFGLHGQVVPFGSVSFQHVSLGNTDSSSVWVGPGLLWFPADSVAVGLSALYAYTKGVPVAGQTATLAVGIHSIGVEPIVGVAIPVADRLSIFPRFSVRFLWNLPDNGGQSLDLITLRGFAPLIFSPASHFYFGFGPEFSTDVSVNDNFAKQTAWGLASEIGGWF